MYSQKRDLSMFKIDSLILPKLTYRFKAIPVKIPAASFAEIDTDPKIRMEIQGTQKSQTALKSKNEVRWIHIY